MCLELELSNRNADLLRRDADLAVRMTRPTQGALVAKRVGAVPLGAYAHRSYLEARGTPETVDALLSLDWIGADRDLAGYAGAKIGGRPFDRELFTFRCDDDVGQLAAVRAGLGVGVVQRPLVRGDPDLLPLLPDEVGFALEMWVVTHEDLAAQPRVRELFDHLVGELGAWLR